jgi:hypothetical protein
LRQKQEEEKRESRGDDRALFAQEGRGVAEESEQESR